MVDLGRLVKKTSAQLSRRFGQFARHYHLTAVQMSLIDYLCTHKRQKISQRDVEHEFLIRRSTASVLLGRMERRGLLIRKPISTDARQRQVILTRLSLNLEQTIVKYMKRQQRLVRSHFSPAEINLLVRLLQDLIKFNQ